MSYVVKEYESFAALSEAHTELLAEAGRLGLFYQEEWFQLLMEFDYSRYNHFRLYVVETNDAVPVMLAPMRYTRVDVAAYGAHTLGSLGHGENYDHAALIFDRRFEKRRVAILQTLFSHFRRASSELAPTSADLIRLWSFPDGSELLRDVCEAMTAAGYLHQTFEHSNNCYEDVSGIDFEEYFSRRSSNHRYNCRRRERKLEGMGELEFEIVQDTSDSVAFRRALDDHILVSVASWKSPGSTVARPMLELIKLAAAKNMLRLGVLRLNGRACAAQVWIVAGGSAKCLRLSYDEEFKAFAPGVVLTMRMVRHLIDEDNVSELDFVYGDESYKGGWMKSSRCYWGILGFNSSTPRGLVGAAKHIVGRAIKRTLVRRKQRNFSDTLTS